MKRDIDWEAIVYNAVLIWSWPVWVVALLIHKYYAG